VSDSVALTAAVDTVLLVAHSGRVTKKDVGEAINRLAQVSAPVVGSILNQSADRQRVNYGYGGNEQPWDAPSLADGAPSDLNA
jgi:Mrp family chromosome partitioning ATPase